VPRISAEAEFDKAMTAAKLKGARDQRPARFFQSALGRGESEKSIP